MAQETGSTEGITASVLAARMGDFIQHLNAAAFFPPELQEALIAKSEAGESLADLGDDMDDEIGLSPLAQMFVINFILQTCLEMGFEDERSTIGLVVHVLQDVYALERDEAVELALIGMQWRTAAMQDLSPEDPEADNEQLLDDDQHDVFLASGKTALRFSEHVGDGGVEANRDEMAFFAAYCTTTGDGEKD